jgi:hypothetical protein
MKKFITILALALVNTIAQAADEVPTVDTNAIVAPKLTLDAPEKKGMPKEFQLGGSGLTNPRTGETSFGFNTSLSIQPLSKPIWFGVSQELGWEPSVFGATDLDSAWSWDIVKDKLSLNTGWSVGATYDRHTLGWRTGPEISLEYYTSGNAFIIVGANYDLFSKQSSHAPWVTAKDNALRYFFGIGISF